MRRVLVVDDSKVIREALEAALEPYGCEVHHADNGAVAIQKLKGSQFDLVLVDIHMPVLDGVSLVRIMRAQGITAKIVLITASAAAPVISAAVKLGVSDYVSKPFQPERIRVVVARALGLEPTALQVRTARVLVHHPNEALVERVRALLPPHVEVDSSGPAFSRVLELAEQQPYAAVLLDAGALAGESTTAAELVRELLPFAAIFAVTEGAPAAACWSPAGALDGVLPVRARRRARREGSCTRTSCARWCSRRASSSTPPGSSATSGTCPPTSMRWNARSRGAVGASWRWRTSSSTSRACRPTRRRSRPWCTGSTSASMPSEQPLPFGSERSCAARSVPRPELSRTVIIS